MKIINFPKAKQQEAVKDEFSIEVATHWIPKKTASYCESFITVGKPYKILYDKLHDEFIIQDDYGRNSVWFLTIEGDFIKM